MTGIVDDTEELGLGGVMQHLQHLHVVTLRHIWSLMVILEIYQIHIIILRKVIEHDHGVFFACRRFVGDIGSDE